MNDEFLSQFLSEVERDALKSIADSPVTLGALEKILLADLYFKGTLYKDIAADPTRNAALALCFQEKKYSNEELGAYVNTLGESIRLLQGGIERIKKLKTIPVSTEKGPNPAR